MDIQEKSNIDTLIQGAVHFVASDEDLYWKPTNQQFTDSPDYKVLKALSPEKKVLVVEALLTKVASKNTNGTLIQVYHFNSTDQVAVNLLSCLMRNKLSFPEHYDFNKFFLSLYANMESKLSHLVLTERPFSGLVKQIENHITRFGCSETMRTQINAIIENRIVKVHLPTENTIPWDMSAYKQVQKLQHLADSNIKGNQYVPFKFERGRCGIVLNTSLNSFKDEQQALWHGLFHHLNTATSTKPSKKFFADADLYIEQLTPAVFKKQVNEWLDKIIEIQHEHIKLTHNRWGEDFADYTYEYIEATLFNFFKGLLWCMGRYHDQHSINNVAKVTNKCFHKIPGWGAVTVAVGNAGIYSLANSKGLVGISHLTHLRQKISQSSTLKIIDKQLQQQAQKRGLKPTLFEAMATPDFNLTSGNKSIDFADYQCVIELEQHSKVTLTWLTPDQKKQKSVPAFIKANKKLSEKLKAVKAEIKTIKETLSVQKSRLEQQFFEAIDWSLTDLSKYYLEHGLLSNTAQQLIWEIDNCSLMYQEERWINSEGKTVEVVANRTARLWHPINSSLEEVLSWRNMLEQKAIAQPFKQAFREVYLLTDAEIETDIYSNRMAAHIIKQHQFKALTGHRGWQYKLIGNFDRGLDDDAASKQIPEYQLSAKFFIADTAHELNDNGIWNYLTTDQIRFYNQNNEVVQLIDIPKVVLSEIMRDVDLFVGVCSVGNDPQWQDAGQAHSREYIEYCESYSRGALSEIAKTRKVALEKLIPRLKIKKVAHISGRYLCIQGKLKHYKIHIGSSNILIEPKEQYLCIVPAKNADNTLNKLFLPFDADPMLSLIISKALLLADDDKIEDPVILSQLNMT